MLLCGSMMVIYKGRLCITSPLIYRLVGLHTRVKIRGEIVEMIETMFQTFRFVIGGFLLGTLKLTAVVELVY
jgi:hypothetical protein